MSIKKLANKALIVLFTIMLIIYLSVWFPNRHNLVLNPSQFLTEYLIIIGGFLPIIFGFIILNLYWKGYREDITLKQLSPKLLKSLHVIKENSYYLGEKRDEFDNFEDVRTHIRQIKQYVTIIKDQMVIIIGIRNDLLKSVDNVAFQPIDMKIIELDEIVNKLSSIDLSRSNPDNKYFDINSGIGDIAEQLFSDLIMFL